MSYPLESGQEFVDGERVRARTFVPSAAYLSTDSWMLVLPRLTPPPEA